MKIENELIVFGQADYAARLCEYIRIIAPQAKLHYFAFPLCGDKPDGTLFDFSLHDVALREFPCEMPIFVGFSVKYHAEARAHLEAMGFTDFRMYDAAMDNEMKRLFFAGYFRRHGMIFREVRDWKETHSRSTAFVKIYMAKCETDKQIIDAPSGLLANVFPIQVGAVLAQKRIADLTDSTGDNISERNRRYSEMTAFYWMWKNDKDAGYLGICHYRRLWVDIDMIVRKLQTTDIDAVLPLPTLCEHSVHEDYLLKYIPTVWQPMMEVMKRRSSDYYEAAQKIFKGKIFYASNMCILRREVLDDLCEWMFPIVMEVEEIVGDIEDPYYNRYAGFCTERLITLYFLFNKQHWKIAHAEKIFIK